LPTRPAGYAADARRIGQNNELIAAAAQSVGVITA
jgi:hypothetical protein